MFCTKCGGEVSEQEKFCQTCGSPLGNGDTAAEVEEVKTPEVTQPAGKKRGGKIALAAIAAAAVIGAGSFAVMKMTAPDPKEVVIDAFKTVYDEPANPLEEVFGFNELNEILAKDGTHTGVELVLKSSDIPELAVANGAGMRMDVMTEADGETSRVDMALIYAGMDLTTINAMVEDDMLKMTMPDLSERLLTMDISPGLGKRIKESPMLGMLLASSDFDYDLLDTYADEVQNGKNAQDAKDISDEWKDMLTRYREGCQAQNALKEAMVVEKGDKASYTINGKEESCQGYEVTISKEAMVEFLDTSSDFFLQEEAFKNSYLQGLKLGEMMRKMANGNPYAPTPVFDPEASYEETKEQVDEMIQYLDENLSDIAMVVYVTKNGDLAAYEGQAKLNVDDGKNGNDQVDLSFSFEFNGGAFINQNATGELKMANVPGEAGDITAKVTRTGVYDEEEYASNWDVEVKSADPSSSFKIKCGGSYLFADGEYELNGEISLGTETPIKVDISGCIEELERGKAIEATIDRMDLTIVNEEVSLQVVFGGEYFCRPLEGEIESLTGKEMDIIKADFLEWSNLFSEIESNIGSVSSKLGF